LIKLRRGSLPPCLVSLVASLLVHLGPGHFTSLITHKYIILLNYKEKIPPKKTRTNYFEKIFTCKPRGVYYLGTNEKLKAFIKATNLILFFLIFFFYNQSLIFKQ